MGEFTNGRAYNVVAWATVVVLVVAHRADGGDEPAARRELTSCRSRGRFEMRLAARMTDESE